MDEIQHEKFKNTIEILKLSKKYRIKPDKISYILLRYGTMEDFLKTYIDGKLTDKDYEVLKDNLVQGLTINTAKVATREHLLLAQYLYENADIFSRNKFNQKGRVIFFDGEKLIEEFHKLSRKQQKIIGLRCGMYEGEIECDQQPYYPYRTLRYCRNDKYSVEEHYQDKDESRGRARLDKAMRGTREIYWLDKDATGLSKEEIEKREMISNKIYNSTLIFVPDKELEKEPDSITHSERLEFLAELSRIKQLQDKNIEVDSIRKLNLPTKVSRPLETAGIKTITQLKSKSLKELRKVRQLGDKSIEKIQQALEEMYPEIREERLKEENISMLKQLKDTRDQLTKKVEKLKSELKDAEERLAYYETLLNGGETQKEEDVLNIDGE